MQRGRKRRRERKRGRDRERGREKKRGRESSSEKSYRKGVEFLCVSPTEISMLLLGLGTTVSSACYTVHVQHVTYMYMYPIPGG